MSNKTLGDQGETCAVEYLRRQGCHILTRNYRTKLGEIDIIADDHGTLVFIEVKTRRSSHYGLPAEAVHYRKQQKNYTNSILLFAYTPHGESSLPFRCS